MAAKLKFVATKISKVGGDTSLHFAAICQLIAFLNPHFVSKPAKFTATHKASIPHPRSLTKHKEPA